MTRGGPVGRVSLNGELLPVADARVSVLDRGFLWGDGVYEVTPCFHGTPFRLDAHLDRLSRSLRFVGMDIGLSRDDLVSRSLEVVESNRDVTSIHPVCRLGHWVTRGTERWTSLAEREPETTLVIMVQPVGRTLTPDEYRAGVHLTVVATRRSPGAVLDPRVKTTSRMNPIVAELEGAAAGGLALMLDVNGHVAEGPTFNVFVVREGELVTPKAANVLPGITRGVVLELAAALEIPTEEADLSGYELATADEFFITASTWGILPVASIDRATPRDGTPGAVTLRLIAELARLTGFHPLEAARTPPP